MTKIVKVRKINKSFVITVPKQISEGIGINENSKLELEIVKKDTISLKVITNVSNDKQ